VTETAKSARSPRTVYWIAITTMGQSCKLVATLASAVLLSRFLMPADFGLIATTAPIIGLADMIRDAGFSQALIQRANIEKGQANALFWLLMAVTGLLVLLLLALSWPLARFFGDWRIAHILMVSAGIMLVGSIGSQPIAWLNRNLDFDRLAILDIIVAIITLIVSVTMAWATHSYWAIVAGGGAGALTNMLLGCAFSGWRPGRPVFDGAVKEMVHFGSAVSFSNVMNFLARNSDNLLIAKFSGQEQLGYYDRAYKLMLLPLTQITWPIARVLTPILSGLQNEPQEYSKLYFRTITFMMTATQPAMVAATVGAAQVITLLLGDKWSASVPIFVWLGAAAVHQLVTSSHGWLYLSQGRGRDYSIVGIFGSVTTVASFAVGVHWGAYGVAIAYVVSDYLLRLPFSWLFVGRSGPVRTGPLLRQSAPHALATIVAAAGCVLLRRVGGLSEVPMLTALLLIAYILYVVVLALFPSKRALLHEGLSHGWRLTQAKVAS